MEKTVVVVGAGLAGMMAAHAAQGEGARVILIDRGTIGTGTNSALSNGVFAGPTPLYSSDEYIRDTLQIGRMMNRESSVKLIAQKALASFDFLRSLGLDLVESANFYNVRSSRPDTIAGVTMVKKLAEKVKKLDRILIVTGFYVTEILRKKDEVYGVKGFDKTGREMSIHASAVVLATGGAGAIYLRNDNQKGIMGQGYVLAARTGLDLWDMEFVQFYPIVIAEPHLPSMLLYPPHPEEVKLVNAFGEDILKKYGMDDLNDAIMKKRDEFSAILFEETLLGKVYMDHRNVPHALWEKYPLSLLKKMKFDFQTQPVAISPAAHFFMGGVRTNEDGMTSLQGLFACGEVVWGLHGANRRGGNALTECVVFGNMAGYNAARYAITRSLSSLHLKKAPENPVLYLPSPWGKLRELRQRIRGIAWNHGGIVRSEAGLQEGLHKIEEMAGQLGKTACQTVADKILKEDLLSAVFVLKAVLIASLARKESRGSFYRKDFPQEDNTNWRKNSCLAYDVRKNDFTLSHHEVVNPTLSCD